MTSRRTLALLRKLLTRHGYDVIEAADGQSAFSAVAELRSRPCLPRRHDAGAWTGSRCASGCGNSPSTQACRFCYSPPWNVRRTRRVAWRPGANDFLSKPFDESELSARLRSLLRTKALQDRLADLLGRYVSGSVAAEVLRDPFAVSLGGDRRHVSTLFADVRGYTAMAAEQPPETTLDLLNRYLTVVSDAVESYGGTVADLLGDGVFAFFGAPVMHSDDPERAVRAALAMQDAVMHLEIPSMQGVRLQMGIGITTGEVIAGNVGSARRMHYAVVGDAVNVAARLQTAAGPGQILIDEPTHDDGARSRGVARPWEPTARRQGRVGACLQRTRPAANRGIASIRRRWSPFPVVDQRPLGPRSPVRTCPPPTTRRRCILHVPLRLAHENPAKCRKGS